ncbi:MAG: hypothetical protein HWD59_05540 [Coxiellaceae bacterium]|nr:MAG: hypothetical protein HWD59_05540 [Coxiellaceae bacterium]
MAKLPNFSGRHWLVGISLVGLSLSGFATTYSTQFNQVGSTWGSGFQAQIISPEKIGNFVLSFTYPKEYAISGYWGGDGLQQSQNCDSVSCTYQFKGYAYNAPLNFGYVVSYAGKTAIVAQPTNIQLTDNANPQDAGVPATPN